jgi:hypothetical protein
MSIFSLFVTFTFGKERLRRCNPCDYPTSANAPSINHFLYSPRTLRGVKKKHVSVHFLLPHGLPRRKKISSQMNTTTLRKKPSAVFDGPGHIKNLPQCSIVFKFIVHKFRLFCGRLAWGLSRLSFLRAARFLFSRYVYASTRKVKRTIFLIGVAKFHLRHEQEVPCAVSVLTAFRVLSTRKACAVAFAKARGACVGLTSLTGHSDGAWVFSSEAAIHGCSNLLQDECIQHRCLHF